MVKYCNGGIVFSEIPDEISLCLFISNCQNNCAGCHSSYLKNDIGAELSSTIIDELISKNKGISCIVFMGEGNDIDALISLAKYAKEKYNLKIALYSGRDEVDDYFYHSWDYLKIGHYNEKLGPLSRGSTNQRLFKLTPDGKIDITSRLFKNN